MKERNVADLATHMISLQYRESVEVVATVCGKLNWDVMAYQYLPDVIKTQKRRVMPHSIASVISISENKNEIAEVNDNGY